MNISTEEEYNKIRNNEVFSFNCVSCGKESFKKKKNSRRESQLIFLCKKCKTEKTCLEKYGAIAPACTEEVREKSKQTCLEKYGKENPMQSEKVKEKSKETCRQKYGTDYFFQTKEYLKKREQTFLENYGVDNPSKNKEIQKKISEKVRDFQSRLSEDQRKEIVEKFKQTCLEKFGVENYSQTEEARTFLSELKKKEWSEKTEEEKESFSKKQKEAFAIKTKEERLEIRKKIREVLASKSEEERLEIRKKIRLSLLSKTPEEKREIRKKSYHKYKALDGEVFDSEWELKYYEYCKSNGYKIEREPVELDFTFQGETHHYYPDFRVGDQLIEIKGNHFLKNGKWICPFKRKDRDPEYLNGLYEAKHQCAIENNVKILYEEDLVKLGVLPN